MSDFEKRDEGNTLTKPKTKRPPMYTVVILNDDYTPMEFVVKVIVKVFVLGLDEATQIMLKVYKEGKARIGTFTFEVADHKSLIVKELAIKENHPLQAYPEQLM